MNPTWAYGVTTVPERRDTYLPATLKSLAAAGFDRPRLFVDGGSDGYDGDVTYRRDRVGAWGNWLLALQELAVRHPAAERYALFQDDLLVAKNCRPYLDRQPLPVKGFWNLFTFRNSNDHVQDLATGWHQGALLPNEPAGGRQCLRGALGLVFSREAVWDLLDSRNTVMKCFGAHRPTDNIDGCVAESLFLAGWREWVHNPSLIWHIGDRTTLRRSTQLNAWTWKGEQWDPLSLLNPEAAAL